MKFLARLAAGDIALWCAFWLIGTPLALVWDFSGGCMLAGCGVGKPFVAGSLVVVFALSCVAIVFVSAAIWRSSSRYPREAWWQGLVATGAKLCAVLSGFMAVLSFLVVMYLLVTFIYASVVYD